MVTIRIITTGPTMMPKNPNIAIPENTDSSIRAESSRACLGTRIGRRKLSMLVMANRWNSTTNRPPAILPKNIIPIPNGMVMIPLPSGITDNAVSRMAKMKNASWKPAM